MNSKVTISNNQLSNQCIEEMWTLYKNYYDYSKASFWERINSNNHFALYHSDDKLIGFTGLKINQFKLSRQNYFLIYFGQTVIDHRFRGNSLIAVTALKLCLKYWYQLLTCKSFFWADTLTYKAYLVFAKSLDQYYPTRRQTMPASIKKLINYIGETHYKETFDVATGNVIKQKYVLTDNRVEISERDLQDADIQFFTKANPNYQLGHGLITVGLINYQNMKRVILRLVRKRFLKPLNVIPQTLATV